MIKKCNLKACGCSILKLHVYFADISVTLLQKRRTHICLYQRRHSKGVCHSECGYRLMFTKQSRLSSLLSDSTSVPYDYTCVKMILKIFPLYLIQRWHSYEAPLLTRAESLGHQPRQAAGDLGPGEVVVIEALDGRDDEGPSHPSVIYSISHLSSFSPSPYPSRFSAAGGSVSLRNSSWLRMTSRPEEFNAAKFPLLRKKRKNFERGLVGGRARRIGIGKSPF